MPVHFSVKDFVTTLSIHFAAALCQNGQTTRPVPDEVFAQPTVNLEAPASPNLEELDLAIANLDFPAQEQQLRSLLEGVPGVRHVRIQEQGALIQYSPEGTSKAQIVDLLSPAGYRVTVFQDSATGEANSVDF